MAQAGISPLLNNPSFLSQKSHPTQFQTQRPTQRNNSTPSSSPGFVDELGRRVTHHPDIGPSPFDTKIDVACASPPPRPTPESPPRPTLKKPSPYPSPPQPKATPETPRKLAMKPKSAIPTKSLHPHFPPLHSLTPYLLSLLFPPPSLLSPKALHSDVSSTSFVSQDTASRLLSTSLLSHFNAIRHNIIHDTPPEERTPTSNIMLTGPSGCGKTNIVTSYLQKINPLMPSTIVDITSYSGTGYVGDSTHDIIRSLYKKCKRGGAVRVRQIITDSYKLANPSHAEKSSAPTDEMLANFVVETCKRCEVSPPPNMAEFLNADVTRDPKKDSSYGVVFVDEIDKVSSYSPHGTQKGVISSREVQNNLLRIIEDSEIEIKEAASNGREGGNSFMDKLNGGGVGTFVSTRNILFIFSGAFHDMNDYLAKQEKNKGKGINGSFLGLAATEDYVKTGFSQEFMGRVPTRIDLLPLTKDDLKEILFLTTSSNSVLRREIER